MQMTSPSSWLWRSTAISLFLILSLLSTHFHSHSPTFAHAQPPAFTDTPRNRIFFWRVHYSTLAPDGVTRPVILVNNKYPGPKIEGNRGDFITVVVQNDLDVPTSFHWHGLTMRDDPWYDGVPGMNQCPIPPGTNFTYAFGTDNFVGTHWWHAHFENQYIDGLLGPLIIREPPETNPFLHAYDEERNIILSDWYHQTTGELLKTYLAPGNNMEPMPNSGLINGKGSFNCSNVIPADLPCAPSERAAIHVLQNRKYRLRIINTSAAAPFYFSVDSHQLLIIEVDGTDVNPYMVEGIPINAGQRYSAILVTNQEVANYWMRAEMGLDCMPPLNNLDPVILGEVRYIGAGTATPTSVGRFIPKPPVKGQKPESNPAFAKACYDVDLFALHPLKPQPILEPITNNFDVKISFQTDPKDGIQRGYLNNITFAGDYWNPTINQNLAENHVYEVAQHVMQLNRRNAVVQIIIDNFGGGQHPFHLHGHVFQLVAQGEGKYQEGKTPINSINPIRRDTITVQKNGFAVIRFKVDNPGVWALHCHIEWHVTTGLVMQFLELPDELRAMGIPDHVNKLCDAPAPPGFKANTGYLPEIHGNVTAKKR
ncbi:hypothetical protein FBU30_005877 [Linnemannia zychae]|nr:hypothetical protein FBU30_005877 [Linnemannia zychae]